ncbi:MAG: hypothetical protein RL660_1819 [Bacteroidota bacterium]|jgi:methionyl-tRNA formyltransferase
MRQVLFLGSKAIGYDCLQVLLQHPQVQVVGVLSNDNTRFDTAKSVKQLAAAHNIPILTSLADLPEQIDILYSVQYHEILKPAHINKAKLALNLHMAPLPEYRGSNQFSLAIIDNKKEFGTSIHKMDALIDHGDIAFEKRFAIPDQCWISDLYELTHQASLQLFEESLEKILADDIEFIPQAVLENERGTSLHFRKEIAQLKCIDLSWPQDKIERHIRATSMPGFEPPYCIINNQKVYFSTSY